MNHNASMEVEILDQLHYKQLLLNRNCEDLSSAKPHLDLEFIGFMCWSSRSGVADETYTILRSNQI